MIEILLILFILLLLLIGFFLVIFVIIKNRDFEVNTYNIYIEGLPRSFDEFKICHLSDMHNKIWGDSLLERIKSANVDIVVITGDIIDEKESFEPMMTHVKAINDICQVYYVTGNHEIWCKKDKDIKKRLKEIGVVVLDDRSIKLRKKGEEIMLLGLSDPDYYGFYISNKRSYKLIKKKLSNLVGKYNGVKILLSHRPDFFELYEKRRIDLSLSGHTHGGQIHIPFIGPIYAPNQGLFPKYTGGHYEKNRSHMIVSRGMNSSFVTLRFNCPKEMIVVNLLRKQDEND